MPLDPNIETVPVEAAGGYVVRQKDGRPEVLMIFRRGVWDLPKGKLDPGETPAQCALREVEEETGAAELSIVRGAGLTIHSYPEGGCMMLKTTWWFIMTTTSSTFAPESREQIERAEWVPWERAARSVGFENLRRHMQSIEEIIKDLDSEMA